MEDQMSFEQLEKLANNPHYKLSQKQVQLLEEYRVKRFKNNNKFAKHPVGLEETDDGKPN